MEKNGSSVDLLDLGEKLIKKTNNATFDQLEVFLSRETTNTIEIEKGSVKKAERLLDMGAGVRSVIGKSTGFAYASSLHERDLLEVINEATSLAKVMTSDPEFQSLPSPKPYPRVTKTVDKRIRSLHVEEAVDLALEVRYAAQVDPRISSINVSIDSVSLDTAIASSLGVSVDESDGYIGASASVVSKSDGEMSSGFELQEAREIKKIDLNWVGKEAASQSVRSLGARKISSEKLPVVFGPKVTAIILSSGIAVASSAENIQRKRSYLTGKLGKKIGSDEITVIDNGILAEGLLTSKFDAEGAPRSENTIVQRGVLKTYLQNSYTASKDGVENTGNATRGGGWDYKATPGIGHTNLILKPGKGDLGDLASEVREGIVVLYTGDRPNLATGEFSAQVTVGFKIENGDMTYPTKQAMMGVNLNELLQDIEAIGNDSRSISGVIAPSIRIREAAISGGT